MSWGQGVQELATAVAGDKPAVGTVLNKKIQMKAPAWAPPVEVVNGLIVEVGRRDEDVIFHLWHADFPADFADKLGDAVEEVMGAPERFEASFSSDIAGVWNPAKNEVVTGPVEFMQQITPRGRQRFVKSWALRAIGYAPVEAAHDKLTGPLVQAISAIFAS